MNLLSSSLEINYSAMPTSAAVVGERRGIGIGKLGSGALSHVDLPVFAASCVAVLSVLQMTIGEYMWQCDIEQLHS